MLTDSQTDELKKTFKSLEHAASIYGLNVADVDFQVYLMPVLQMSIPHSYDNFVSRYAHWSFGKRGEQYWRGMYPGESPSEIFIPSHPPRAFVSDSLSMSSIVSTFARLLAYQDFASRSRLWLERDFSKIWDGIREHARFVQELIESKSVDALRVEETLTVAHSLAQQCRYSQEIGTHTDDLLEKISEHPSIESWQRDLMLMVHHEWGWSLPYLETSIMVAGWTHFWQLRLMRAARVMPDIIEYSNAVSFPPMGSINPNLLGVRIFQAVDKNFSNYPDVLFNIVSECNDASFIKRYLTQEIALECGLFSWGPDEEDKKSLVVKELSDEEGWKQVRDNLVRMVGGNQFPAFRVLDPPAGREGFFFQHVYEGRALDVQEAKGVMGHIHDILGIPVYLRIFSYDKDEFKIDILSFGAENLFHGHGMS